MSLWSADELIESTNGNMQGRWDINGLSIDSREIAAGDLFVALKAARDGHEFVASALEKGAAGALVSHVPEGLEAANLLVVDDVEAALARMGQFRRAQVDAKVVAVTGSAGKTSTKEMLLTVLSRFGKTHASVKSFNNHWGVPLTLARMPRDTEFGIFEIGMNHPGEIEPLVKMVRPHAAIITNIAAVHLAGFDNEEGIAREKASILLGLETGGLGIVNGDMIYRDLVANFSGHKLQFFGEHDGNDIIAKAIAVGAEDTRADIHLGGEIYELALATSGRHHALNALAVVAVLDDFGLDIAAGTKALSAWIAPAGRGQVFTISSDSGTFTLVDESYNANPLSMRAAIDAFRLIPANRHVAILGDMGELGAESSRFHQELANYNGLQALDLVHVVGEEMQNLYQLLSNNKGKSYAKTDELLSEISTVYQDGDAIMIKGSLYIGLGKVVDALKEMGQSTSQ